MPGFEDITVVSVTGWQPAAAGACLAVQKSALELPGSAALLISPEPPAHMPRWVRHVAVHPFGYLEYGLFMLFGLHQFIDTDYALVVQDDGWVLSGRNWRAAYFDCDYIGAPVHLARVRRAGQAPRFMRRFTWACEAGRPGVEIDPIFNGGFSLRSRRLLRAPRELGLSMQVPPPLPFDVAESPVPRMAWEDDSVLEDVWLCIAARPALQAAGLRFASLALAAGFSIEHTSPGLHDGFALDRVLGHHSKLRKIVSIGGAAPVLRYTITEAQAASIYGETALSREFLQLGWRVEWAGRD